MKGTWAWRVEGHHLSLNFTVVDGEVAGATPSFFGTNPGEVREGPRKGLRVLGAEEDLGRQLAKSLSEEQKAVAILPTAAPQDIITSANRHVQPLTPEGLPASRMTQAQRQNLSLLLSEYVSRHRPELAEMDMRRIQAAGLDKIHFAWAGGLEPGEAHYYRVQGPTFVMEYDNTQNNANHIHTVWRDFDQGFRRGPPEATLRTNAPQPGNRRAFGSSGSDRRACLTWKTSAMLAALATSHGSQVIAILDILMDSTSAFSPGQRVTVHDHGHRLRR